MSLDLVTTYISHHWFQKLSNIKVQISKLQRENFETEGKFWSFFKSFAEKKQTDAGH